MENKTVVLPEKNLQAPDWLSEWSLNSSTSSVKFFASQRNFLARPFRNIEGAFKVFEGFLQTNSEDFADANIYLIIEPDSVDTANKRRDKHLLSTEFFATQKFPFIRFRSVSFEKGKNNNYILEGDCTIRGVTKRLTLDVVYKGCRKNEYGNKKICFQSTFQINRHDFGFKSNVFFETLITKEITVKLDLEFFEIAVNIY
jgi:polyisoprenoid-binding protein YceI